MHKTWAVHVEVWVCLLLVLWYYPFTNKYHLIHIRMKRIKQTSKNFQTVDRCSNKTFLFTAKCILKSCCFHTAHIGYVDHIINNRDFVDNNFLFQSATFRGRQRYKNVLSIQFAIVVLFSWVRFPTIREGPGVE